MIPPEPKRAKAHHAVFTIYRNAGAHGFSEVIIEQFQEEVGTFLDVGYKCLGAGMTDTKIFAVMAKKIVVPEESSKEVKNIG